MSDGYTAFVLDAASRQKLLDMFQPKYGRVVAHHVTHEFGATRDNLPQKPQDIRVVGFHDDGKMQVLAVEVDERRQQPARKDGSANYYHITLSLDAAAGAETHHANDVLKQVVAEKGEAGLRNLSEPVTVEAEPRFIVRLSPAPNTAAPCAQTRQKIRQTFGR